MTVARLTARSTHGRFTFCPNCGQVDFVGLGQDFGAEPVRVDVEEWRRRYPGEDLGEQREVDILDLRYWDADGNYSAPCEDWRTDLNSLRTAEQKGNEMITVTTRPWMPGRPELMLGDLVADPAGSEAYICAQVDSGRYALIGLVSGNRHSDPVKDIRDVRLPDGFRRLVAGSSIELVQGVAP